MGWSGLPTLRGRRPQALKPNDTGMMEGFLSDGLYPHARALLVAAP